MWGGGGKLPIDPFVYPSGFGIKMYVNNRWTGIGCKCYAIRFNSYFQNTNSSLQTDAKSTTPTASLQTRCRKLPEPSPTLSSPSSSPGYPTASYISSSPSNRGWSPHLCYQDPCDSALSGCSMATVCSIRSAKLPLSPSSDRPSITCSVDHAITASRMGCSYGKGEGAPEEDTTHYHTLQSMALLSSHFNFLNGFSSPMTPAVTPSMAGPTHTH